MKHSVEQIKAWALENYEVSWGASVIIECMSDDDIAGEFKGSLAEAKRFAEMQNEQLLNTEAHLHKEF